ncbi:M23 family metallopeptidase [Streptomyces sp. NBC_00377]|uniref:M23 family metallopeptidase n=1 Tax=unclassified Streptomyces TaxID=2593676 RepID=UPI002E1C797F|nr:MULTISPECIES: M23 family metallopeptidase [unclassified Streptomyces]
MTGSATGAALIALLLLALTAVPAGAGSDGFRREAARAVHAHERARARVDRLREADAPATMVRAAERRRKAVRAELWDLLWAIGRNAGDPVAVDPYGRDGHCPFGDRSHSPERRARHWTVPTRHYWLSAGYAAKGSRWAHRHTGQDFAVGSGSPVYAVGAGTVRATTCGDGFGNQIVIRHRDGYFTQYAHLSRIDVRKGGRVKAGQRIGLSGATGNVTGPHLHFEVRITPYLGSAVPPLTWLRRKDVRVDEASAPTQ